MGQIRFTATVLHTQYYQISCGRMGLVALGANSSKSVLDFYTKASSVVKGNSLVLTDNPARSLQVS